MFKKLIGGVAVLLLTFAVAAAPVAAAERGTTDEAKVMAEKASALLKREGKDKAFAAFNGDAQFKDRDLYVFVMDKTGTIVAHGANASLVGKNLMAMRDPSGKQFIKEMVEISDRGWVDYSWQNPTNKAVEPKRSYVIQESGYVMGVGAYVK